jgi:hypothetical protein
MWVIKMVFQAFGIFSVSIFVLLLLKMLTSDRNVATGMGVAKGYGVLLIGVGLWYVAFGMFMVSPAYEWVLRQWLKV